MQDDYRISFVLPVRGLFPRKRKTDRQQEVITARSSGDQRKSDQHGTNMKGSANNTDNSEGRGKNDIMCDLSRHRLLGATEDQLVRKVQRLMG